MLQLLYFRWYIHWLSTVSFEFIEASLKHGHNFDSENQITANREEVLHFVGKEIGAVDENSEFLEKKNHESFFGAIPKFMKTFELKHLDVGGISKYVATSDEPFHPSPTVLPQECTLSDQKVITSETGLLEPSFFHDSESLWALVSLDFPSASYVNKINPFSFTVNDLAEFFIHEIGFFNVDCLLIIIATEAIWNTKEFAKLILCDLPILNRSHMNYLHRRMYNLFYEQYNLQWVIDFNPTVPLSRVKTLVFNEIQDNLAMPFRNSMFVSVAYHAKFYYDFLKRHIVNYWAILSFPSTDGWHWLEYEERRFSTDLLYFSKPMNENEISKARELINTIKIVISQAVILKSFDYVDVLLHENIIIKDPCILKISKNCSISFGKENDLLKLLQKFRNVRMVAPVAIESWKDTGRVVNYIGSFEESSRLELDFSEGYFYSLKSFAPFPSVKKLLISALRFDDNLVTIFPDLEHLTLLQYSNHWFEDDKLKNLSLLRSLKSLNIGNMGHESSELSVSLQPIILSLQNCPSFQVLRLNTRKSISGLDILNIASPLNLELLDVPENFDDLLKRLESVSGKITIWANLDRLIPYDLCKISKDGTWKMLNYLDTLRARYPNVSFCKGFYDPNLGFQSLDV